MGVAAELGGGTGQASVPSPGSVTTVGSPGGDPWWPLPQPSVSGILGDSLVLGYETANLGPFRERDIYGYRKPKRGGRAGGRGQVSLSALRDSGSDLSELISARTRAAIGSQRPPITLAAAVLLRASQT